MKRDDFDKGMPFTDDDSNDLWCAGQRQAIAYVKSGDVEFGTKVDLDTPIPSEVRLKFASRNLAVEPAKFWEAYNDLMQNGKNFTFEFGSEKVVLTSREDIANYINVKKGTSYTADDLFCRFFEGGPRTYRIGTSKIYILGFVNRFPNELHCSTYPPYLAKLEAQLATLASQPVKRYS